MKLLLFPIIGLFLLTQNLVAQNVGIGTATPEPSAKLDISANDKGLLIPRVALSSTADVATIPSPATSLLIYNTATIADVTPGFYYYNGTTWNNLDNGKNQWNLEGNAGTIAGTHFIGTTDAQALQFRTNNMLKASLTTKGQLEIFNTGGSVFLGQRAGESDDLSNNQNVFLGGAAGYSNVTGANNVAVGYQALLANTTGNANIALGSETLSSNTTGSNNTGIGMEILNANTTGSFNTGVGYRVLYNNTTGYSNVAIGANALYANLAGRDNTALGYNALRGNISGFRNLGVGYNALRFNTDGDYNIGVGYSVLYQNSLGSNNVGLGNSALYSNTAGGSNIAIGSTALYSNTTGSNNIGVGQQAAQANTTGSNNTAIGYQSMLNNVTGSNNTAVGRWAMVSGAGYTNSTALGYNTAITASNQIRLGNNTVTSIGGYVNWTNVSDGRFKTNIKEDVQGLAFINELRPVTYNLDMDAIAQFLNTPDSLRMKDTEQLKAMQTQTGFIAQEVEASAKALGYDFSGVDAPKNDKDHYGLRYAEFTVPLVKAVQELSEKNNQLEKQMEKMMQRMEILEALLSRAEK